MNKKLVMLVLLILILAAGGGYYFYSTTASAEETEEIVLEENQQLVYAKITAISGNEMTYALAEAESIQVEASAGGRSGNRGNADMSAYDTVSTDDDGNMTGYIVSEDTQTLIIPVGTDVVTKLGNVTTFSRLTNGDIISMILQTDTDGTQTIMKVYMVA